MTNLVLKIALGSLVATGLVAFAQEPKENPQPEQAQAQQGQPQTQSAEQVFAMLDTNKDGKVSQEEFAKLFRDAKVSDVQAEFTKWDKNGDKSLTMEEFKAGYPQR